MRNLVSLGLPVFHYGHLLPPPPFRVVCLDMSFKDVCCFLVSVFKKNNVFFVEYFLIK